jgi:hypothetical protein
MLAGARLVFERTYAHARKVVNIIEYVRNYLRAVHWSLYLLCSVFSRSCLDSRLNFRPGMQLFGVTFGPCAFSLSWELSRLNIRPDFSLLPASSHCLGNVTGGIITTQNTFMQRGRALRYLVLI